MTKNSIPPDRTAMVPFILFGIFAAIVTYCIIRGTRKGVVKMEEDVLYIKPESKL